MSDKAGCFEHFVRDKIRPATGHDVPLGLIAVREEDAAATGRATGFNVVQTIADHPLMRQVHIELTCGLDQ